MDIEFSKVVISTVAGIVATFVSLPAGIKAWAEVKNFKRATLRAEVDFAWTLADRFEDPDVRRYAKQLSYSAIIFDLYLTHKERKFLLSMDENEKAVTLFLKARDTLQIDLPHSEIHWKRGFLANPVNRKWMKRILLLAYIAVIVAGLSPIMMWYIFREGQEVPTSLWIAQAIAMPIVLTVGVRLLMDEMQIGFAEELMLMCEAERERDITG